MDSLSDSDGSIGSMQSGLSSLALFILGFTGKHIISPEGYVGTISRDEASSAFESRSESRFLAQSLAFGVN